jgi:hypothetical protein
MVGGIHKMSTLVQWAKAEVIDLRSGQIVLDKEGRPRHPNPAGRCTRRSLVPIIARTIPRVQLANNFLSKDRCALPDQMSFALTFPWRGFVFAMRNRD